MKVDIDLLRKQTKDMLDSNIKEDSKTGLHHLLGEIVDEVKLHGNCVIIEHRK